MFSDSHGDMPAIPGMPFFAAGVIALAALCLAYHVPDTPRLGPPGLHRAVSGTEYGEDGVSPVIDHVTRSPGPESAGETDTLGPFAADSDGHGSVEDVESEDETPECMNRPLVSAV